jgi:hypothetical protein
MELQMTVEQIDRLIEMIEEVRLEKEHVLDAIRQHRASKTPSDWSQADVKLYEQLPEVQHGDIAVR